MVRSGSLRLPDALASLLLRLEHQMGRWLGSRRPAAQIRKINQLYFAAVKGDPQVTLLDTWTLFADTTGDAEKAAVARFNLAGSLIGLERWAEARPLLEAVLADWMWSFAQYTDFEFLSVVMVLEKTVGPCLGQYPESGA